MYLVLFNYQSPHYQLPYLILYVMDHGLTIKSINKLLLDFTHLPSRVVYCDGQVIDDDLSLIQVIQNNDPILYELGMYQKKIF